MSVEFVCLEIAIILSAYFKKKEMPLLVWACIIVYRSYINQQVTLPDFPLFGLCVSLVLVLFRICMRYAPYIDIVVNKRKYTFQHLCDAARALLLTFSLGGIIALVVSIYWTYITNIAIGQIPITEEILSIYTLWYLLNRQAQIK